MITASRDPVTQEWALTGPERTVQFKAMCGAFGWGDPGSEGDYASNAVVVVGAQPDGSAIVLEEAVGNVEDVGRAAIDMKDRLDLEVFYLDPEPADYRKRLMKLDGLTYYHHDGYDAMGRKKYTRPSSHWPNWRGWGCVVSLLPVQDSVLADLDSYLSRIEILRGNDKLLIADWCNRTRLLSRETFEDARRHPLSKALVWAISGLLYALEPPTTKHEPSRDNLWYGNRR